MVGLGNNVAAGYAPEAGAREVFADLSAPTAGIAAPIGTAVRVGGGIRLRALAFASGITHCDWPGRAAWSTRTASPGMTPHGPEMSTRFSLVRDVEIHDTWHVSGLRAERAARTSA
ncbi:MAG: hypothetical protein R2752_20835 [Vicinamibacterales bacterium]